MSKRLISYFLIFLQVIAGIPVYAVTISQTPVGLTVKPNLILGYDDSGSMAYEVLMNAVQGSANFDGDTYNFLYDGFATAKATVGSESAMLSYSGRSGDYVFRSDLGIMFTLQATPASSLSNWGTVIVPPADSAAMFRSSDYNPLYYNPNITYTPWVKTVNAPSSNTLYAAATATAAKYDPTSNCTTGKSCLLDLTSSYPAGSTSNSQLSTASNTVTSGTISAPVSPITAVTGVATYDCTKLSTTINYSSGGVFTSSKKKTNLQNCNSANTSKSVVNFTSNYTIKSGQSWLTTSTTNSVVNRSWNSFPFATYYKKVSSNCGAACVASPDTGFWLQRVIISTGTASYSVPSRRTDCSTATSTTSTCTYNQEINNFANWFQYARSRRQLLSYAMSSVITSVTGMRIGMIPFNSSITFAMYDLDTNADVTTLLSKIYTTAPNGSTPTPDNLKAIGAKFNSDTSVIQYSCQKNAAFILTDGYANVNVNNVTPPTYDSTKWGATVPYTTTTPKSIADISLSYYTNRLRSSDTSLVAGQVPKDTFTTDGSADQNTDLHMNTYALTLGADGVAYQEGIDPYANTPTWVTPVSNQPSMIDDLWHGTINGRGQMFSADNVSKLIKNIKDAFVNISLRAGTRASIGVASKFLNASNNAVYVPSYNVKGWVGDVKKLTVDLATATIDNTAPVWSAKDQLEAFTSPATDRKIVTYTGSAGASFNGTITTLDPDLVAYIRGDTSKEVVGTNGIYRNRGALFGDVINASPAVVTTGAKTTVYQASNDGMLHALDAATGNELWAYVPKAVWGQLANFASNTGSHEYIVDGSPISTKVGTKTMLVGGLGYNTKAAAYYALDITDPTATDETAAARKVMWEFPSTDAIRANLGTSTSRPLIINTKSFTGHPQVVVISSGYNNIAKVGTAAGDGKGHVWFLNPANGDVLGEIITNTGTTTAPIGLAPLLGFAVNPKVDSTATALYGGDEVGNVWKFDISTDSTTWTSSNAKILAVLRTSGSNVQPVTSAVQLSIDPLDLKPLVFVGTGQLLNSTDVSDTTIQSFYAIKDMGDSVIRTRPDVATTPTGATKDTTWVKKVVTLNTTSTDTSVQAISDRILADPTGTSFDWSKNNAWYFDYISTGERVVGNIQFSSDRLLFSSTVISSVSCTNPSFTYSLDSKGASKFPITTTSTSGVITTSNVAGHYTGEASSNSPLIIVIQSGTYGVQTDANGKITVFRINTLAGSARLASWREIIRK